MEFLAKLYFHRVLNLEGTDELLLAQKAWLQERLTQIEAARARTSAEDFRAVVLDLRGRQVRAAMEWVEGLIPRPAEGGGSPS